MLAEVTGLDAVSLQPAAGSQGELTGLMLMRAYFADRGEGEQRRTIVVADTAHGTNPASVTMAGYELQKVATDARGNIDLDDLRGQCRRLDGRPDADEPLDARPLRRAHRGDREDLPRSRRRSCTTTAPISTPSAGSRGPATWASTSSTSTCTRRSRSRTAAAGPEAARSRFATASSRFCRCRPSSATGTASASTTTARSRSARCARSPGRSACSSARTRSSSPGARSCGRCRRTRS